MTDVSRLKKSGEKVFKREQNNPKAGQETKQAKSIITFTRSTRL